MPLVIKAKNPVLSPIYRNHFITEQIAERSGMPAQHPTAGRARNRSGPHPSLETGENTVRGDYHFKNLSCKFKTVKRCWCYLLW